MRGTRMGVLLIGLMVVPAAALGPGTLSGATARTRPARARQAPETPPGLERRFDTSTVFLFSVSDLAALSAPARRTALGKALRDPEIRRFLAPFSEKARRWIEDTFGMPADRLASDLPGQVVLGVAPPAPDDPNRAPRVTLLVRLGQDRTTPAKALAHVRARGGRRGDSARTLPDGTPYDKLAENAFAVIVDDLLAVVSREQDLARVLKGPLPPEERLVETERFKAAMRPVGPPHPEGLIVYLDVVGLITHLQSTDRIDPRTRAALDHLGISQVQAAALTVVPGHNPISSRLHLYAPGWRNGILASFGEGARALFETVPADATGAAAVRLDPADLFDVILGAGEAAGSKRLARAVERAHSELGLDLRGDVIQAMGKECVIYVVPVREFRIWLPPRVVMRVSVKDRDALEKALDRLGDRLQEALARGPFRYAREPSDGVVWHVIRAPAVPPLGGHLQLFAALGEKHLVLGTRKEDVEKDLAGEGRPLRRNFLHNRRVREALDRVGGDGAVMLHLDPVSLGVPPYTAARLLGLPSLDGVREAIATASCAANLQQISEAMARYRVRHERLLPPESMEALIDARALDAATAARISACPVTGRKYLYIPYSTRQRSSLQPEQILVYELGAPHRGGRNVLFWEGEVRTLSSEASAQMLARVPADLRADEPEPSTTRPLTPPRDRRPIAGLGPLPSPDAVFRRMPAEVVCLTVTKDGLVMGSEAFAGPLTSVTAPVIAGVLLPAVARARHQARQMFCASHLRQIGIGVANYATLKNGALPASLDDIVKAGLLGEDSGAVLKCPATGTRYGLADLSAKRADDLTRDTPIAYDAAPAHHGRRNVLFADGHVDVLTEAEFQRRLRPGAGKE